MLNDRSNRATADRKRRHVNEERELGRPLEKTWARR